MVVPSSQFRCSSCDAVTPRWVGRCPQCQSWNSLSEEARTVARSGRHVVSSARFERAGSGPVELCALRSSGAQPVPTVLGELDRVLGGGVIPSSVTLLAGEPGIGKSTLVLQTLAACARKGITSLLVCAEEAPEQVHRRAIRLGLLEEGMWITSTSDVESLAASVCEMRPGLTVVDSIQTVSVSGVASPPGSVAQVRAASQMLADSARSSGSAMLLIGHVTKDGSIAGPRILEHLVDTVLSFEGDRHQSFRILRAVKHRFGAVGEMAMWEMTAAGLAEVRDPAGMVLADRQPGLPGSAIFAAMEGQRPMLVEVQALVTRNFGGSPRRSASGYDQGRLAQVLAVLEARVGLGLGNDDVYVSAVGGVRLDDPGADLAVAMAVASASTNRVVDDGLVVVGEVGLGGELRSVANMSTRLVEAARHRFARATVPRGTEPVQGIATQPSATLGEALNAGLRHTSPPPRLRVLGA